MTMSPVGAMVLAAALVAPLQTQVTPPPLPNTPAECLRVIGQWFNQRQREAGSGLTSEFIRQITEQRAAMAKVCVAPFDLQTAAVSDLPILAQLYAQAGQKDLSKAALDRALGQKGMTEGDRATVLVDAIRLGLSESKSPERNAQLERYVDELDAMSNAVFNQKLSAHTNLNGYYRADDIDAGIIKHSQWIIAAGDAATPADRQKLAIPVVSAHNNLAQVWAGQGKTAEALALLEGVLENWKDAPASTLAYLASTIERYRLVGTPGAAITAPRWLNASGGATALPMTGKVTLLEFTAHWCGPCKESYPGLKPFSRATARKVSASSWPRSCTSSSLQNGRSPPRSKSSAIASTSRRKGWTSRSPSVTRQRPCETPTGRTRPAIRTTPTTASAASRRST